MNISLLCTSNAWGPLPTSIYSISSFTLGSIFATFVPWFQSDSDNSGMEFALNRHPALSEFISFDKNDGLTHVVVDNNPNRPEFLKDVFYNEEKFSYLTKIYDSSEQGYNYHLKIFRIDYEKFESVKEFN